MRILSLGGAGAVCEHATRDLVAYSDFDQIVIGEKDLASAERLANDIGDPRVVVQQVDADDLVGMINLFKDFDVILNGLPFKYDLVVTKACVAAGVNGLDVSTEEEQWDFHRVAKEKDLIFIPGVGATPGTTNVMARRAADLLDEIDEIQINFAAFRCLAPAPGLLTTTIWEFHPEEKERVFYQDDHFHQVGPFEGIKMVHFPGPIGEQEVCYIPHEETWTMPKTLGAKAVSVRGCFPPHIMRLMRAMVESGLYSEKPLHVLGVQVAPLEMMQALLIQLPESRQNPLWAYGLVVEVTGTKEGRQQKIRLWNRHPSQEIWGGPAAYYKNIGIPLSIGAQMIARGDVQTRGVVPAEVALDPAIFFAELQKRGIIIHEEIG